MSEQQPQFPQLDPREITQTEDGRILFTPKEHKPLESKDFLFWWPCE